MDDVVVVLATVRNDKSLDQTSHSRDWKDEKNVRGKQEGELTVTGWNGGEMNNLGWLPGYQDYEPWREAGLEGGFIH